MKAAENKNIERKMPMTEISPPHFISSKYIPCDRKSERKERKERKHSNSNRKIKRFCEDCLHVFG